MLITALLKLIGYFIVIFFSNKDISGFMLAFLRGDKERSMTIENVNSLILSCVVSLFMNTAIKRILSELLETILHTQLNESGKKMYCHCFGCENVITRGKKVENSDARA